MARDGSGTYSLPATLATPNGVASSATANSIMDDIAQALTDSINKDGTKAFAANQSMGNNRLTSLASATSLSDAATLSQVQSSAVQQATVVAGTVDAIALTFFPQVSAYTTGMRIRWVSAGPNTIAAPTVNCSALGTRTIKKNPGGAALAVGDTGTAGTILEAIFNGTDFILLNPPVDLAAYATNASVVGQQTIWVPAGAMVPTTTNGAASGSFETSTNDVMLRYLAFDASTKEKAQFAIQMPRSWDEGTIIAQFVWTHPSTATNFGVSWELAAVAFANDDAADAAFGTLQEIDDVGGTTHDIYISDETPAITVAGSPGAEEYVVFQVSRDPADAGDTMAVDAWLLGVKIHYTTNAAKDD